MNLANWLTAMGDAGHRFIQSLPDVFWLAYAWAKDWQVFLGGVLVLIAAQIFAHGSVRAARIRAGASVRAAQIAVGTYSNPDERRDLPSSTSIEVLPAGVWPQRRGERDLVQELEKLRSLIRSAMVLLASDDEGKGAAGNIYCERIARLRFEEKDLAMTAPANAHELYKRFLHQLATVRRAQEKGVVQSEMSEALFQLNARARELAATLAPHATAPSELARLPGVRR